jgi:hypothetical protein
MALLLMGAAAGCEAGGVGDPCIPEEEYAETFSGFALEEVYVESRSFQCETRVCLVNKFQGRVSCPYGTNGVDPDPTTSATVEHTLGCALPGGAGQVSVPVRPWRTERPPETSVYCSCRCAGDDPNARYCECPSGFSCSDIGVTSQHGHGQEQLLGSYCIRDNSDVQPDDVDVLECALTGSDPDASGACGGPLDSTAR